jgi:DNA replication licensing factor MCM3
MIDIPHPRSMMKSPAEYLPAFDHALREVLLNVDHPDKDELDIQQCFVGYSGSFGDLSVNPRTLRAHHLGKLISLEGIVTRCKSFERVCLTSS